MQPRRIEQLAPLLLPPSETRRGTKVTGIPMITMVLLVGGKKEGGRDRARGGRERGWGVGGNKRGGKGKREGDGEDERGSEG